ncbi:MAG: hypothetical protein IT585_02895 [candidate division Zixibacteria bacterium]|nr:hypothetical protein [candidate division Zixibacteria bacterium]
MEHQRDFWDKLAVILQPLGGLLTAVAIAMLGFFTSQYLERQQSIDANTRLYSELMSNREQSESALRKDMFVSIIGTFLRPQESTVGAAVLNLELLAYNFHESLNLKPLFTDLRQSLSERLKHENRPDTIARYQAYQQRLERVAREITKKQMIVLEGVGVKKDWGFELGPDFEDATLETAELSLDSATTALTVDVVGVDFEAKELRLDVTVRSYNGSGDPISKNVAFSVGFYDFPMIDNTRLPNGQRFAVIMNNFSEMSAEITVVLFPGAYASLKEKPYYDEVIDNIRKTSQEFTN